MDFIIEPAEDVTLGLRHDDDRAVEAQLMVTELEARTMVTMPGGINMQNWLILHGLGGSPVRES